MVHKISFFVIYILNNNYNFVLIYRFINCKEMAKKAIVAVEEKKLIITPQNCHENWFHWLKNIQ